MLVRLIVILCVLAGGSTLSGCQLSRTQPPASDVEHNLGSDKNSPPNPKPRPKSEPIYPPAAQVIAWHAKQCGGFTVATHKTRYLGEQSLNSFFHFMCRNMSRAPQEVMNKLLQLEQRYSWPDNIKQYLWLQKQHIKLQINAKKAQQALNDKMQHTLSSLATIEQQLLLREDTKEQ